MRLDPFIIQAVGGDIRDRAVKDNTRAIDGDIIVADSYRKHPRHQWAKFRNNRWLFLVCLAAFAALAGKLYYLQIVRGAEYYGAAEDNRIREAMVPAPRGVIFDATGQRLAFNIPDWGLFVVPADLPPLQADEDKIFSAAANVVGRAPFDLVESFARVSRQVSTPVEIMRGLTQEQAVRLERPAQDWQGVAVRAIEQRAYARPEPFAHVLGYTGPLTEEEWLNLKDQGYLLSEHAGKTGIEKTYESVLRGSPGQDLTEINSLGKIKRVVRSEPAVPGSNIYLSIEAELQNLAWQELAGRAGSVIAIDPRNGAILALVSYPAFDSNLFAKGIDTAAYQKLLADTANPLFNRTISGEYPSGSTFKIIVAAAALEENLIDSDFTVLSTGGWSVNGYRFPDWKAGGHGRVNVVRALAESVNTFFYTIGGGYGDVPGLGLETITDYGRRFGLTAVAGIDLPGENAGFLPSQAWKIKVKGERWFLGDTYHLAIGQGDILVTPLQVANFTAAMANGGTLFKPKVAAKIVSPDGDVRLIPTEVIRERVVSAETVTTVKAGLRAAVTAGSARSLSTLSVPLAGKTGTAEVGGNKRPHAWFTGFGPYEHPEIVVTVLVEGGQDGNISATPIAKKIFEWYFTNKKTDS